MAKTGTEGNVALSPPAKHSILVNAWALLALVTTLFGLVAIDYANSLVGLTLQQTCTIFTLYALFIVGITIFTTRGGVWTPSSAYLSVLVLFHFGTAASFAVGQVSDAMALPLSRWFYSYNVPSALYISALGVSACCIGVLITNVGHRPRNNSIHSQQHDENDLEFRKYLSWAGCGLVLAGVFGWYAGVLSRGGFRLLIGSYSEYLEATKGLAMAYVWLALGLGLAFLSASQGKMRSGPHYIAYTAFGVFAIVALPLGLRGEVLFASLGALVVSARRGVRPSTRMTIVGALIVLVAISMLREVRQYGVGSLQSVVLSGSLMDGPTELGSTLRPVAEVVGWKNQGEVAQHGATYVAPISRALCSVFAKASCIPAGEDTRLMNVVIANRVGPIGFSPIAEAYVNFRLWGVFGIFLVLGLVTGKLNHLPVTTATNAFVGIVMVELLINVRNSFTAVPTHLVIGVICICCAWFLAETFGKRPGNIKKHRKRKGGPSL